MEAREVLTGTIAATTLDTRRDSVDIELPFFRDLLADNPVAGADTIQSLADWSGDSVKAGEKGGKAPGRTAWDREAEKISF